jgi:hypothetical protein
MAGYGSREGGGTKHKHGPITEAEKKFHKQKLWGG